MFQFINISDETREILAFLFHTLTVMKIGRNYWTKKSVTFILKNNQKTKQTLLSSEQTYSHGLKPASRLTTDELL